MPHNSLYFDGQIKVEGLTAEPFASKHGKSDATLRQQYNIESSGNLNEHQKKAAEYQGKHLLVLAGAGTGKTKTIIARAEYLIKSGVHPNRIAILSFTRKSAQEIAERVKSSVSGPFNTNAVSGRTFHSWCNEIMQIYPDYFPQSKFTLLDEDDQNSAMKLVIGKNFKDSQGEKLKAAAIVSIYSYTINTLCSLSDSIKHLRYYHSKRSEEELKLIIEKDRAIIAPVIKQYIEYKTTRQYIDYDDMLAIVAKALQENEIIRKVVTNRWEHILVDEMQDTNPLQYKLLKSFFENTHLFCVGDDAQSIYAFRGADFKTIHSFTDRVPHSEAYKLLLNYRSTQEILDLSNWVLEKSPLNYDKKLLAFRGKGEKPKMIHAFNDWEEANIITDDIIQSVTKENCEYRDTMVLGRSRWSLSKVEGACIKKKIPYRILGGTSIMRSAHVRDVAAAMRIVANNYDEIAWMRYLQIWKGIGEVTATKIISHMLSLYSFDNMIYYLKTSNNQNVITAIHATLENVNQYVVKPAKALRVAVESMNKILSEKYKNDNWDYRIRDFDVLEEVAKTAGSISEFITEYVLDPRAETTLKQEGEVDTNVVTLSTIHSAKGLEAKNVHIVDVNPFGYPNSRAILQGDDAVEEERRCLYVALTRAKDNLKLYRNARSLHTQSPRMEQGIRIHGYYITKSPENTRVKIMRVNDGKVTTCIVNEGKMENQYKIDVYAIDEFKQVFVEVGQLEEQLYFLNGLPSELVETVVSGENRIQQEKIFEVTEPAKFPDFNFE